MYIQPPNRQTERMPLSEVIVPKNYSGNAFRQYVSDSEAEPPDSPTSIPPTQDLNQELPPSEAPVTGSADQEVEAPVTAPPEQADEAIPTWRGERDERTERDRDRHRTDEQEKGSRGGLLSRFPFLSSLLPPSRGKHKKDGILPEWVLIAAVILLFYSEDGESDILPFLLLLLLWD